MPTVDRETWLDLGADAAGLRAQRHGCKYRGFSREKLRMEAVALVVSAHAQMQLRLVFLFHFAVRK
jgi:hypothetical protein